MKASALVMRLALAAFAVGAVACKKEAEPAKAASSENSGGGGDTSQAGAETSAESRKRNAQLPAMPRQLGDGSEAGSGEDQGRRRPWGDGPPPDRAAMKAMRDERRKEALETYDNDKNGELDDEERQVMHEARVADMVARMDQNADGKLTKEELEASTSTRRRPPPDFTAIDTNKDGFVTVEEMAAARPPIRGRGMPREQ